MMLQTLLLNLGICIANAGCDNYSEQQCKGACKYNHGWFFGWFGAGCERNEDYKGGIPLKPVEHVITDDSGLKDGMRNVEWTFEDGGEEKTLACNNMKQIEGLKAGVVVFPDDGKPADFDDTKKPYVYSNRESLEGGASGNLCVIKYKKFPFGDVDLEANIWEFAGEKQWFLRNNSEGLNIISNPVMSNAGVNFDERRRRLKFEPLCTEKVQGLKIGFILQKSLFEYAPDQKLGKANLAEKLEIELSRLLELVEYVNAVMREQLKIEVVPSKVVIPNLEFGEDPEVEKTAKFLYRTKTLDKTGLHLNVALYTEKNYDSIAGGWVIFVKRPYDGNVGLASGTICSSKMAIYLDFGDKYFTISMATFLTHELGHTMGGQHPFHSAEELDKIVAVNGEYGIMSYGKMQHQGIAQFDPAHKSRMCRVRRDALQRKMDGEMQLETCFTNPVCPEEGKWGSCVADMEQHLYCQDGGHVVRECQIEEGGKATWGPSPPKMCSLCKDLKKPSQCIQSEETPGCTWNYNFKRCVGAKNKLGEKMIYLTAIDYNSEKADEESTVVLSRLMDIKTGSCEYFSMLRIYVIAKCSEDGTQLTMVSYKDGNCTDKVEGELANTVMHQGKSERRPPGPSASAYAIKTSRVFWVGECYGQTYADDDYEPTGASSSLLHRSVYFLILLLSL